MNSWNSDENRSAIQFSQMRCSNILHATTVDQSRATRYTELEQQLRATCRWGSLELRTYARIFKELHDGPPQCKHAADSKYFPDKTNSNPAFMIPYHIIDLGNSLPVARTAHPSAGTFSNVNCPQTRDKSDSAVATSIPACLFRLIAVALRNTRHK